MDARSIKISKLCTRFGQRKASVGSTSRSGHCGAARSPTRWRSSLASSERWKPSTSTLSRSRRPIAPRSSSSWSHSRPDTLPEVRLNDSTLFAIQLNVWLCPSLFICLTIIYISSLSLCPINRCAVSRRGSRGGGGRWVVLGYNLVIVTKLKQID